MDWVVYRLEARAGGIQGSASTGVPEAGTKETFGLFLDGLLSGIERNTGWLMAEQAGLERPYRIQSLGPQSVE